MKNLLASILALLCALAPAQALYAVTETAAPGGALALRGDGLDRTALTIAPYSAAGKRLGAVPLPLGPSNGQVAVATVPAGLPAGIYEVGGTVGKTKIGTLFVNRPRVQWCDVDRARPGEAVYLVGRNFGPAPKVTITGSGRTYTGAVVRADDAALLVRLPRTVKPGAYNVAVLSGAGTVARCPVPTPLEVLPPAADPFGLGVSWGADFAPVAANAYDVRTDPRLAVHAVGDGAADDTNALRLAIKTANDAGGGTIDLPAGTYRVQDGGGLELYGGVVLRGAGKGLTTLVVGYTPVSPWASAIDVYGDAPNAGIVGLTIVNQGYRNNVLTGVRPLSRSFLKDVEVRLGEGNPVAFGPMTDVVVDGCAFASDNPGDAAWRQFGATRLRFVGTAVAYRTARTHFVGGSRLVLDEDAVSWDESARGAQGGVETGGLETSGVDGCLVWGCAIGGRNALPTGLAPKDAAWCGEAWITQDTSADYRRVGMASGGTATTLVSADPLPDSWVASGRQTLMIVGGKGAGQWRWIAGHAGNTLTVDRPWDAVPDATTRYNLVSQTGYRQTFVGNRVGRASWGVSLFSGSLDCLVARNAFTNSGPVTVRSDAIPWNGSYWMQCAWDVVVDANTTANTDNTRPATIGVLAFDETSLSSPLGALALGVAMRGNSVAGSGYRDGWLWCVADGMESKSVSYGGAAVASALNLGTIVEGNAVSGSALPLSVDPTAVSAVRLPAVVAGPTYSLYAPSIPWASSCGVNPQLL